MKIITRDEALASGLNRYYTGIACPRGHITQRRTGDYKCTDCVKIKRKRWHHNNPEKVRASRQKLNKSFPYTALYHAVKNAIKRRPLDADITIDYIIKLFNKQEGKCALTGITMTWGNGKVTKTSVSIDRRDNNKGYTKKNVRLICHAINSFKGDMMDAEMYEMARALLGH